MPNTYIKLYVMVMCEMSTYTHIYIYILIDTSGIEYTTIEGSYDHDDDDDILL